MCSVSAENGTDVADVAEGCSVRVQVCVCGEAAAAAATETHGADAWRVWMGREQREGSVSQLTRHVVAAVLGPRAILPHRAWLSVGDERLPSHHPAFLLRPHDTLTLHLPTVPSTAPYLSLAILPVSFSSEPDKFKASIPTLSPTHLTDPVSLIPTSASASHTGPVAPPTVALCREVTPPTLSKYPPPASSIALEKLPAPAPYREVTPPALIKSPPPASSVATEKFPAPAQYREVTSPALSKAPSPASSVAPEKFPAPAQYREVIPPAPIKSPPPASSVAPEEFLAPICIIPHTSSQVNDPNQTWRSSQAHNSSRAQATALTLEFEAPGSCSTPPAKRRRVRRRRRRTPVDGFSTDYGESEENNAHIRQNEDYVDGQYPHDPRSTPTPKSVLHLPLPTFAPRLSISLAPSLASSTAPTFVSSPAPTVSFSPATTLAPTAAVAPAPTPVSTLGRVVRAL